jgi:catechol 2,3-dioxygenase-like lactoylglutathione lyase family enzyme
MRVTEIAFSVYAVTDLKRAQGFYERTLGLKSGVVHLN